MASIKKLWPFRSATNFTLTVLGVSFLGLTASSVVKESNFSSPVIAQAIKILSTTQRIKEALGYPLTYKGSFSNEYSANNDEQYYSFTVKGSFGAAKVELLSSKLPVEKVLEVGIKRKEEIEKEQESIIMKLQELRKVEKGEKNKNKKAELNIELKHLEEEMKKNKIDIELMERKTKEKIQKYYIPDQQYYAKLVKGKMPNEPLPNNAILHGIDSLAVQLPNKTRVFVIPSEDNKPKSLSTPLKTSIYPQQLQDKLKEKVDDLSEKQLAEYSRHKTNFMYEKYGSYRFFTALVLGIGGLTIMSYFFKNRVQNLKGSIVIYEAERFFQTHPKIMELVAKNQLMNQKLKWSKSMGGGMRNNEFECVVYIEGLKRGKVHLAGNRNEDKGENKYEKFVLEWMKKGEIKKVDLLV